MKPQKKNPGHDQVLHYLSAAEIDDYILGRLISVKGVQNILVKIAEGSIKASIYQHRNAIHVLGKLGDAKVIPNLLTAFKKYKSNLRSHILVALGRIGPDQEAQAVLKDLIKDEKAEPAEIAYALQALTKSSDKEVLDDLLKHRPAHLEDSGVWESFARLRVKARKRSSKRA